MLNSTDKEFVIENLVIHGNVTRARQLNMFNNPVGGVPTSGQLWEDIKSAYPSMPSGVDSNAHSTGIPAICIKLVLNDFFRTFDGTVGCTIQQCYLRPVPGNSYYSYNNYHALYAPCPPADPNAPSSNYNSYTQYCLYMPRQFTIGTKFIVNGKSQGSQTLFTFNGKKMYDRGYIGEWGDNPPGGSISQPIKLTGTGVNRDDRVIISLWNLSLCACPINGNTVPVFATDISEYIPDAPGYVWRRFGTLSQEQALASKHGYELPDTMKELCDQKWHLIRPFYYIDSGRWRSVEDN